jgi:hypothetical protein
MTKVTGTASLSYAQFKERIPRLDQQARVAWKVVDLLYKDAIGTGKDLIMPTEMDEDESRFTYVVRRGQERLALIEPETESYIVEKGFGTETAQAIIRHRQAPPGTSGRGSSHD